MDGQAFGDEGNKIGVARSEDVVNRGDVYGRRRSIGIPGGSITLDVGSRREWDTTIDLSPAEARRMAAELLRIADEIDEEG